jgi:hypothetical protein
MTTRRLPAPWRAEKMPGGYIVRDANGQALAYVYCRANEAEALQAKVLTGRRSAPHRYQHCKAGRRHAVRCPGYHQRTGRDVHR